MAQRKIVQLQCLLVAVGNNIVDAMEFFEGKAIAGSLQFRPVKHGGHNEETGKLKSVPSGREFVMLYITKHPRFTMKNLISDSEGLGLSRSVVYQATGVLVKEGVLKRTAPGEYAVAAKAPAEKRGRGRPRKEATSVTKRSYAVPKGDPVLAKAKRKMTNQKLSAALKGKPKPKPGETMQAKIISLLQRAPEDGMDIADIKKVLQVNGANTVSPTLSAMLKKNLVTRPKARTYLLTAQH